MLNQYITDLTVSGNLSKQNIADSKHEQRRIVNEIKTIKYNLDNIIQNTDDISLSLKNKNII